MGKGDRRRPLVKEYFRADFQVKFERQPLICDKCKERTHHITGVILNGSFIRLCDTCKALEGV